MTDSNWPRQEGHDQSWTGSGTAGDTGVTAGPAEAGSQPNLEPAAFALDDTDPGGGFRYADDTDSSSPREGDLAEFGTGAGDGPGAVEKAKQVAGQAGEAAAQVKDAAVQKASEVKDVAVERAGDVAGVTKDELGRVAGDVRAQVQDLWSQTSAQLGEQVDAGRAQLAELLRSLADELGEMASGSTQAGPVTSLARQAAQRGGELSRWLSDSHPADLVNDIRRFARRRPVVFLGGALLAGVVVGRLGRGLMAAAHESGTTDPGAATSGAPRGVAATSGVTGPLPVSVEEVPSFGAGEPPTPTGLDAEATSVPPVAGEGELR